MVVHGRSRCWSYVFGSSGGEIGDAGKTCLCSRCIMTDTKEMFFVSWRGGASHIDDSRPFHLVGSPYHITYMMYTVTVRKSERRE